MRASCVLPDGSAGGQRRALDADDVADLPAALLEELALRARRWPAVLEETIPARLAVPLPHAEAAALAVPLLFDRAEPVACAANLLRLERPGLAPVELDPATGAWRCTATGATGRGVLELVAWARGCTLLLAAAWLYAASFAERRQARLLAQVAA